MDLKDEMQRACCSMNQIGNLGLQVLWHVLHLFVNLWYLGVGFANAVESSLVSSGLLKRFKAIDLGKLRCIAVVIESEDASDTAKVVQLVQWLEAIGVRHICLYDMEGVLKKSKEYIIANLNNAILYEGAMEKELLLEPERTTLEIASTSDGKEAVAKAASIMFGELAETKNTTDANPEDRIFTEKNMTKALRAVGCGGPEPELLLVYGPARCHLGFPPWRIRYTEIVHMGSLKSMKHGALVKAVYDFTMVNERTVSAAFHDRPLDPQPSHRCTFVVAAASNIRHNGMTQIGSVLFPVVNERQTSAEDPLLGHPRST